MPKYNLNSMTAIESANDLINDAYLAGKEITLTIKSKSRTNQQRKAIEVYCAMLARHLNSGGYDLVKALSMINADIPWTQAKVKEDIWRPLQLAAFDIKSTTKLDRKQVSEVYEIVNRMTADNFGIGLRFPSYDGREYKD